MKVLLACVMAGSLLGTTPASAKVDIRQEQIQLEKGTSRATITDTIRGDQIDDYRLRAGRTAVSVIALHQSITSLAAWPVKAPLTDDQVMAYVDKDIFTALLALTLADSGGWNLFDPPAPCGTTLGRTSTFHTIQARSTGDDAHRS